MNAVKIQAMDMNIIIKYNVPRKESSFVNCNTLYELMQHDANLEMSILNERHISIPSIFGILHYISGCDYLPHLRGFSKLDCIHAFIKFGSYIIPTELTLPPNDKRYILKFTLRFFMPYSKLIMSSLF